MRSSNETNLGYLVRSKGQPGQPENLTQKKKMTTNPSENSKIKQEKERSWPGQCGPGKSQALVATAACSSEQREPAMETQRMMAFSGQEAKEASHPRRKTDTVD